MAADEERNELGDRTFFKGPVDSDHLRRSQHTYVFHYYNPKIHHYFPYFRLVALSEKELERAKQDPDFQEVELYKSPDGPPFDEYIRHSNRQLGLRVKYFMEVFEERSFIEGYQPSTKFYRVILIKSIHQEIERCIEEYNLQPIHDLVYELIAITQEKYVEHIAPWETDDMQKIVNTADTEARKVIDLLDRLDSKPYERGERQSPPPKLKYIKFGLPNGDVRLEHPFLISDFINNFKKSYNEAGMKDWRLELERFPEHFEDNVRNQQFKYKLALSFYNLLTGEGFFTVTTEEPRPNQLMLGIVRLLEFCLIPIGKPSTIDEDKPTIIRNWLKRNEIEAPMVAAEVPADTTRLLKYFEPDLIHSAGDIKDLHALSIASGLSKRFKLPRLFPDFAHLIQALTEIRWLLSSHFVGAGSGMTPTFPELTAFNHLTEGLDSSKKLKSLKFTLEGDETEHELTQRLPLHIIEQAIKEYSEDHSVEFNVDAIPTKITRTESGELHIQHQPRFNNPANRFLVRFVGSFYAYLLAEAPPGERDYMPSERYYAIIGAVLTYARFLPSLGPDQFAIQKVKEWHRLFLDARKSSPTTD